MDEISKHLKKELKRAIVDLRLHSGIYPMSWILRMHDEETKKHLMRLMISMNLIECKNPNEPDVYSLTTPNGWNYNKNWQESHPVLYDVVKMIIAGIIGASLTLMVEYTRRKSKDQQINQLYHQQELRLNNLSDSIKKIQKRK